MSDKPSVLIVDDDPILRAVAGEMLRLAGYDCAEAEDGAVALHYLKRARAELAIVDMLMPNKEGLETIGEIRARWPYMRIIAISGGSRGMAADHLLRMAELLGADAAMLKPLRAPDFLKLVEDVLAGRATAAA